LEEQRVHHFKCADGRTCEIDSRALRGTIRLNILTENIGNLNASSKKLLAAGLVSAEADLAPTMGIGWLDIVLRFLGPRSAIIHYLSRRKTFEQSADYMADELDLVTFYLDNGFNIGTLEEDGTPLLIYGHSNKVDVALTRSRDQPLGEQENRAITTFWQSIIGTLEDGKTAGWLTVAVHLRNIALDDQTAIERLIRRGIYRFSKEGPTVIDWHGGGRVARPDGVIAVVQGKDSCKQDLSGELRSAYHRASAAGVIDPIMLLFLAPGVAPPVQAVVIRSEEELITASVIAEHS
jgi:hypothetical protein